MHNKKILTVQDLYQYLLMQNQNLLFSSLNNGYEISIATPGYFEVKEYKDDEGLIYCDLKAFHDLSNSNKSFIEQDVFKKRIKTMKDRPIMADIVDIEDKNGNIVKDFSGHSMYYDEEKNKTVYVEIPVGHVINPENIRVEYDEEYQRNFALADCVIYEEYTDTCDILRRRKKVDCSVELCVRELSFDSSTKELRLDDYYVQGITLLGESVLPGMKGSNVTLKDFSMENNSIYFDKTQLINEVTTAVLEQLSYKLASDSPDTNGKEEQSGIMHDNDVNINFEETEAEETETKPVEVEEAEVTTTTEEEEIPAVETEAEKSVKEDSADATPEVVDDFADDDPVTEETEETEDHQSVSAIEDEDSTETRVKNSLEYSATFNGQTRSNFATLNEQLEALWILVNDTYGESDNEWYSVDADPEKKLVYMHGWSNNYRQSYKVKNDVFSLTGDRVKITPIWVSDDERKEFEKMISNYSSIESELNEYKSKELHSQREAVLDSKEYSVMAEFDDFKELKSHMDEYTVEELTEKADLVYAKFMKSNYSTFSAKESKKHNMVFMTSGSNTEEEKLPYGGLFKNFKNKK